MIYVPNRNLVICVLYLVWGLGLKLFACTVNSDYRSLLIVLADIEILLGVCYLFFNIIANSFFYAVTDIMCEKSISYEVSSDILMEFKAKYYKYLKRLDNMLLFISGILTGCLLLLF